MTGEWFEELRHQGARFVGEGDAARLVSFGDPDRETATALGGCILADNSTLGQVRMRGADIQGLLHRLSTNDISHLKPGQGNLTVFLNSRGRVLDMVQALVNEGEVCLITSAGNGPPIRSWLEQYIFREDVTLDPHRPSACLGIYGPAAPTLLAPYAAENLEGLPLAHHRAVGIEGVPCRVARTFPLGGSGFLVLFPSGSEARVWTALREAGALPAGQEALERLRVAAGVPLLGHELTESYNPWEVRLDDAISLTKGCYLGQEVVARLKTYQKVQRRLAGLEVAAENPPPVGSMVLIEDRSVGVITSSSRPPLPGRPLALSVLERPHPPHDIELAVRTEQGDVSAHTRPLSFGATGKL